MSLSIPIMIESARNALGWPYVSPGSNDKNGIDCSGLFVRMYRDQGNEIAHGSNTIFRKYCSATGPIIDAGDLLPGMAVFKIKDWTDADQKNSWYGTEPGNLSHIGFVVSVSPLEIIHASTGPMCVTTDTKLGKWKYWGRLKAVDYGTAGEPAKEKQIMEASVWADNGSPVKLRQKPSTSCPNYKMVDVGETVLVSEFGPEWSKVSHNGYNGYMMTRFLTVDDKYAQDGQNGAAEAQKEPDDEDVLRVNRKRLEAVYDELGDILGLRG